MPNYDVNVRRDWFLPLVGGAELNRIKLPNPIIFTSRPYFIDVEDRMTTLERMLDSFTVDFLDPVTISPVAILGGSLRTQFQEYRLWERESVALTLTGMTEGTLRVASKSYTGWPREEVKLSLSEVTGGSIKAVLISYPRWATEEVKNTLTSIIAGTLT